VATAPAVAEPVDQISSRKWRLRLGMDEVRLAGRRRKAVRLKRVVVGGVP
jgi:hypothetical protein